MVSRSEYVGETPIEIVNHTRWSTQDLCGRILNSPLGNKWFVLKMPVEHKGEMLCPKILPFYAFKDVEAAFEDDKYIWRANYYQEPVDMTGSLFQNLLTYDALPDDYERVIAYCDTRWASAK